MPNMTNAQAALQAAAVIYTGSAGDVSLNTIQGMAAQLKRGLDRADEADKAARTATRGATPTPARLVGFNLSRVAEHYQASNHNSDPVCGCSWDPALEGLVTSRESARTLISLHIVENSTPSS